MPSTAAAANFIRACSSRQRRSRKWPSLPYTILVVPLSQPELRTKPFRAFNSILPHPASQSSSVQRHSEQAAFPLVMPVPLLMPPSTLCPSNSSMHQPKPTRPAPPRSLTTRTRPGGGRRAGGRPRKQQGSQTAAAAVADGSRGTRPRALACTGGGSLSGSHGRRASSRGASAQTAREPREATPCMPAPPCSRPQRECVGGRGPMRGRQRGRTRLRRAG